MATCAQYPACQKVHGGWGWRFIEGVGPPFSQIEGTMVISRVALFLFLRSAPRRRGANPTLRQESRTSSRKISTCASHAVSMNRYRESLKSDFLKRRKRRKRRKRESLPSALNAIP